MVARFARPRRAVKPQCRAARRRRGLDSESADRAINVTAMRVVVGQCPRDQVPDFTDQQGVEPQVPANLLPFFLGWIYPRERRPVPRTLFLAEAQKEQCR
jgi:hypothetical protein